MANDKVLGRRFQHFPVTPESIGYLKRIARPESADIARIADEPAMARHDITELVPVSKGVPLARRAGPGS